MFSVRALFEALEALPTSAAIRESLYGYPLLLTGHVVSMCIFAGLIAMMDMRLLGIGFKRTPFSELQKRLFPWQMVGLVLSSITRLALFYGQPMRYYGKVFFWVKMGLMIVAGVNALIFHLNTYRSIGVWDRQREPPFGAKLAGAFGLVLWAGVVVFGRLTAYNWLTFE
jgi:hypothetical protein